MLALPDVAELVGEQVVRRAAIRRPPEEDRPPERVAVVAEEPRQPEEERRDDDPYAVGANGRLVQVERVEARLRARERSRAGQAAVGTSWITPVSSCACVNW